MKTRFVVPGILAAAVGGILFSTAPALAASPSDFTGVFSGFYAPSQWTTSIGGNSSYVAAPAVITSGAPNTALFIGALGEGNTPQSPSTLDYSIVLPGTGPVSVSFTYAFFNPTGTGNEALVLDNGTVVGTLSTSGTQFSLPNVFNGGNTLDIRLVSDVVNLPDILEIAPVPEPSTLALAGLSTAAFLFGLRFPPRKG